MLPMAHLFGNGRDFFVLDGHAGAAAAGADGARGGLQRRSAQGRHKVEEVSSNRLLG